MSSLYQSVYCSVRLMCVLPANIKEQLFVHTIYIYNSVSILTYFTILLPVNMKFYENSKKPI